MASKNRAVGNGEVEGPQTRCEQKLPEVLGIFGCAERESASQNQHRILQGGILEIN
jgi:hypothetical protein